MHTTDRHRGHATANCLPLLLITSLFASIAFADEPRLVPFQARLTDASGADLTGVYRVTFVIYDAATGGTALWSEVHPSVSVIAGRLNVLLGSITSLDDYNGDGNTADAVQFDRPRFVGIKVQADTNQEMVPRHQLVPAFQAVDANRAAKLGGSPGGFLTSSVEIVPVGAIISFMGDPATLPENWKICDGSIISDPVSPLNGSRLPDLRGQFVRGEPNNTLTLNVGNLSLGGREFLNLQHIHSITQDAHNHTIAEVELCCIGAAQLTGAEQFIDAQVRQTRNDFSSGMVIKGVASDFIQLWGSEHTHTFPLRHSHGINSYSHAHGGATGQSGTLSESVLPPFVGLHYIMRIK